MAPIEYVQALVANYLNQVTAYTKKRYNPAALAQYNEIVAHVNGMVTAGLIDGGSYLPDAAFADITAVEQIKTGNLPLYTVFMDEEASWGSTWPVPYAT